MKIQSSLQAMRLLVHDAVDAMKNNDTSRVLVYLNLVEQQLGVQQSKNETLIAGSNITTNAAAADHIPYIQASYCWD